MLEIKEDSQILVIGESCYDMFVYCDATRLCPDVPVPVLNVKHVVENPGMAKNVQRNIEHYHPCDILTNDQWKQVVKTRIVDDKTNHHFVRVDYNDKISSISRFDKEVLIDKIKNYAIIVISDYNKGFLSIQDIELISQIHDTVFIDTKKILGPWVKGCKYIKINDFEYNNSKQFVDSDIDSKLIHTAGGDGCYFNNKNYPTDKVEVKDVSGAGDSFMAALVVKYLETSDIEQSIEFANLSASKVVKQRGVSII